MSPSLPTPIRRRGCGRRSASSPWTTLAHDVRDRTLELLAAIDELDYTSDALERVDRLPVNTVTAPVFDAAGSTSFAVALHVADPELPVPTIRALGEELRTATEAITAAVGGRLPDDTTEEPFTPAGHRRAGALTGGTS